MEKSYKYDVFLSYSQKDKKTVHALAKRLKEDGLSVWLDEWVIQPGDPVGIKIQEGIDLSRILVVCMSPDFFESEWTQLEYHTLLFRDPKNTQRRFIPLVVAKCAPPDIIAQFAYIDWSMAADDAYRKLLTACRRDKEETTELHEKEKITDQARMVLEGHTDEVWGVTITPDGKTVISCSRDNTLKVWDICTGLGIGTIEGHRQGVRSVDVTPDGKVVISSSTDNSMKVWNLDNGKCLSTINGVDYPCWSVNVLPNGKTVATAAKGNSLGIWNIQTGKLFRDFKGHSNTVRGVDITPDGLKIVSGSKDTTIKVWDIETGLCSVTCRGHNDEVEGLSVTPDGKTIISGSRDNTIKVWDIETGLCLATFEGHTNFVRDLVVTDDGKKVVSASSDKTLKIWDLETGQCCATFKGHSDEVFSLAITPDGKSIVSGSADTTIRVWDWQETPVVIKDSTRYTNAKVILAGETGVGKSGLAMRLARDEFEATLSTDAHWVSRYPLPHRTADKGIDREIWLWDFAGQPDYRLTHQLFMDETELAAIVFNPQDDNPFEGIGQWDGELMKAARRPFKKLLVAGRCDRGGLIVTKKSVEDFYRERGFAEYIETSALTGEGCRELYEAIVGNIEWNAIPWTATKRIFKRLKEEIIQLRDEGVVLLRTIELKQRLELCMADESFTMEELLAVVGLLAGPGLIWKLEFGDFVLLQPEKINAYASAVVRKVRKHTDEIGCILEQDIINGNLDYQDMKRLSPDDEAIVLRAMHQTFVDHGICMREGAQLVLPSLFKRERPELVGHPAVFTSYQFTGGADEIYATLVVRLHHTSTFENDALWKFAADFKTDRKLRVGIKMEKKHEGAAEILVYCDPQISDDTKVTFIKYVHEHLLRKGVDVKRYRHYVCGKCGHPVKDSELAREILQERGKKANIICQKCGKKVQLWDLLEMKFASKEFQRRVQGLEEKAKAKIDSESKTLTLIGEVYSVAAEAGQIFRQYANFDQGIDGEIEFKNDKGEASGKRIYLHMESGDFCLRKRNKDEKDIYTIKEPNHVEYWQAQAYPVMLVIRMSDGDIRWMNITDYLNLYGGKIKKILFDGKPFTALDLIKLRKNMLGL